jgi:hypothetical protein
MAPPIRHHSPTGVDPNIIPVARDFSEVAHRVFATFRRSPSRPVLHLAAGEAAGLGEPLDPRFRGDDLHGAVLSSHQASGQPCAEQQRFGKTRGYERATNELEEAMQFDRTLR